MSVKRRLKSFASASYESKERRYFVEAAVFAIGFEQRVGVGDRRPDFARHAKDAGRRKHALDVEIVVRRDADWDRSSRTPRDRRPSARRSASSSRPLGRPPASSLRSSRPARRARSRRESFRPRCCAVATAAAAAVPPGAAGTGAAEVAEAGTMLLSSRGRILGCSGLEVHTVGRV